MTLADLIRRFRAMAKDEYTPYLWSDAFVTDKLNDAQVEAVVRGRLLLEDANAAMCSIAVTAGQASYTLHAKLYELVRVAFKPAGSTKSMLLSIVTREWLDNRFDDWRDWIGQDSSVLRFVIQDEGRLRMVPAPATDGQPMIEAYRLPLASMTADSDEPEIHEASQEHLIEYAMAFAFRVPDAESFDPNRAQDAEDKFAEHFGLPVNSDLRRSTREDVQQLTAVYPS